MTWDSIFLTLVAVVNVGAKLFGALLNHEASYFLPCTVEAKMTFPVRQFEDLILDCVRNAQPIFAACLDGI